MPRNNISYPLWQLLMLVNDHNKAVQFSCDECFALLEYDADLLAAGAETDQLRQVIGHHLALCSECRAEMNMRLKKLEGDCN
jgi:hypothetical protein